MKYLTQNFIPVWNHKLKPCLVQASSYEIQFALPNDSNETSRPFVSVREREQVQDTVKVGSVLIDVETGDSSAPTPTPPKPEPTPAAPVKDAKDACGFSFKLF